MTLRFFFERLALIGSLASLVIALIWPHFEPFLDKFIRGPINAFISSNFSPEWSSSGLANMARQHEKRIPLEEPPRLSGRTLRRTNSQSSRSIYSSLEGYRQTPLSIAANHPSSLGNLGGGGDGGGPSPMMVTHGARLDSSGKRAALNGSTATLFTIFTAVVVGLIIYTMAKMLSARLLPRNHHHQQHGRRSAKRRQPGGGRGGGGGDGQQSQIGHDYSDFYRQAKLTGRDDYGIETDLRCNKRNLLKLSKEQRVRQLILHHGGKNVSHAIKFLVTELQEQKQSIMSSLAATGRAGEPFPPCSCTCSCHDTCDDEFKSATATTTFAQDKRQQSGQEMEEAAAAKDTAHSENH